MMTRGRAPRAALLGLALLVGWSVSDARAAPPFGGTVREGLGIAAHWPAEEDLDQISRLGFSLPRTDLSWGRTERARGSYDFGPYLDMARAMRARGIRPIFILDYGNGLYAPDVAYERRGRTEARTAPPTTAEARAAYVAWANAAVEAFAAFDPIWEIWNEPDQARFWPPEPDPEAYALLAGETCQAMRAASPRPLVILGPAVADWIESDYLRAVLANAAADCFDAISVHPYQLPGRLAEDTATWAALRREVDAGAPGPATPIANTEWGRSVFNRVTEEAQAAYFARTLVLQRLSGVDLSTWYVWRDPGDDPRNDQHHFGVLHHDGAPRLIETAIATLVDRIGDARARCVSEESGIVTALFDGPGELTLVLWTEGWRRTWTPPAGLRPTSAVSLTGEPLDPARIPLSDRRPVYVTADPDWVTAPCAAAAKEE